MCTCLSIIIYEGKYPQNIVQNKLYIVTTTLFADSIKDASAGNRTRAARVAGEHSTTEPPMRLHVLTWMVNVDNLLETPMCGVQVNGRNTYDHLSTCHLRLCRRD
jgi:hypothetical protein